MCQKCGFAYIVIDKQRKLVYKKDDYISMKISNMFGIDTSASLHGDGGKTVFEDNYSWLNDPSVFQWLKGEKGWGFYQQ